LLRDRSLWENKVKKYSALFLKNKDIYGGQAWFSFTVERKNLVTTEGVKLAQNLIYSRLFVTGFIKADDGMELPLYLSYFAFKPGDLPKDEVIVADIEGMIKKLEILRNAPVVDPYTGPAILSGRAAGVFFHEIFGHRIEGHRQKREEEGQTFKKKIDEKILPEAFTVVFDPTIKNYAGRELVGFYKYDDEGVPTRRVQVVENGVFKSFLMSRSPVEGFSNSNGHGRAQAGFRPVARQSNLIVESKAPAPEAELRRMLIEECKKQDKPFGLLFQDIQGGFTFTGRTIPNAFNVLPTEVYRVYTDGRPDELVRGVDLVGTPLVMFSMVSQAGDRFDLFNGVCGAESGGVPVSAVSPALLVSQVEVQKKSKSQERPPILPRPDTEPTM
jgi:predicted Zn-dependent protease